MLTVKLVKSSREGTHGGVRTALEYTFSQNSEAAPVNKKFKFEV